MNDEAPPIVTLNQRHLSYRMFQRLFFMIPPDIISEIHNHFYAIKIQRILRKFMFRHTYTNIWSELRGVLIHNCSVHELAILFKNEMVRREWRMEPGSWVNCLQNCNNTPDKRENIQQILNEVECGMWKLYVPYFFE